MTASGHWAVDVVRVSPPPVGQNGSEVSTTTPRDGRRPRLDGALLAARSGLGQGPRAAAGGAQAGQGRGSVARRGGGMLGTTATGVKLRTHRASGALRAGLTAE